MIVLACDVPLCGTASSVEACGAECIALGIWRLAFVIVTAVSKHLLTHLICCVLLC